MAPWARFGRAIWKRLEFVAERTKRPEGARTPAIIDDLTEFGGPRLKGFVKNVAKKYIDAAATGIIPS